MMRIRLQRQKTTPKLTYIVDFGLPNDEHRVARELDDLSVVLVDDVDYFLEVRVDLVLQVIHLQLLR